MYRRPVSWGRQTPRRLPQGEHTTTYITDRSSPQPVGPPPSFAPELAPVIEVLTSLRSPNAYRLDNIVEIRKPVPGVEAPTEEVLSRGGIYSVQERAVPGLDGQPDISLPICLPKHAATPTPAIYHKRGRGQRDHRTAVTAGRHRPPSPDGHRNGHLTAERSPGPPQTLKNLVIAAGRYYPEGSNGAPPGNRKRRGCVPRCLQEEA